jgi:alpha-galactosidase
LAAPLIAGNDLRNMTSATLEILTNSEVIAVRFLSQKIQLMDISFPNITSFAFLQVDQDPLGQQGHRIYQNGSLEIWARFAAHTHTYRKRKIEKEQKGWCECV